MKSEKLIGMNHKDLDVWRKSMDFVEIVYALTASFPTDERYALTSQMRRAAVSIPSNIAEGAGRKSNKELVQFLHIALGSLAELDTQYLIAVRLKYCNIDTEYEGLSLEVKRLLIGFRNYLQNK